MLLAASLTVSAGRPGHATVSSRAGTLDRWALEIVDRGDATVEDRQRALRFIQEAIVLEPEHAEHWLVLGRLQEQAQNDRLARSSYARAIALVPTDPGPRMRLAQSWKLEWLRTLDPAALDRSIAQLDTVTRLRPYASAAWLGLVPLYYERPDVARAAEAAEHALAGRPRRAEAPLAVAYLAYRTGAIERSDSLFRVAIPRLDSQVRALFEDPMRVLRPSAGRDSSAAGSDPGGRPALPSLAELDPDPTTAANEVELECWSRIAHAWLLFSDSRYHELDARAETYIRYGPPAAVLLNPTGTRLYFDPNPLRRGRYETFSEYPLDALRWDYPQLGMRVLLHDRSLSGRYTEPVSRDFIPGTIPDPHVLERRPDLISLGNGHAVLPTLPPASQRLDVRGVISGFEGEAGPRLLVQARVAGTPADTLIARWVARDASGREVARGEQSPGVSMCDPAAFRTAAFAAGLPAGRYDVAVSVRDSHLRRGLYRNTVTLAAPDAALALSDLVLCCGDPASLADERGVRIEADPDARVGGGRPLVAYFEIYRLARGPQGTSRFRYEYEVRRMPDDAAAKSALDAEHRPAVDRWTSREETHLGALRRQFVRVQTSSLEAGRYQLRVRVRDLVAGGETERRMEFVKN
jgi:Tfp pilus assembly protein PilF